MKAFQFLLIWNPTKEQEKKGEKSKLVSDGVITVLASDQNSALLLAGRLIPEGLLNEVDQIEVAIRPF